MKVQVGAAAAFAALVLVSGCSSAESAQADDLCSRLDSTPIPAQAVYQWSQFNQADCFGSLMRAAAIVRERCPQHARFAQAVEDIAAVAPKGPDGRPIIPPNPATDPEAANLQVCVEQSGMTEQQCREATARGEGG